MKRKLTYGTQPRLTANDVAAFSHGNYDCRFLLQDRKGLPVVVSQMNDPDCPIWKVVYDNSCVVFASYEEAMAYCKGRFSDLSGGELEARED